ncbi:MAG: AAA family ATPase [Candidatus Bathyarchaeia archaeon]|jgi:septum site-determining protein MinD
MKTISIHSSRGGTGKTEIATNLACVLASRGFNVALLDVDFRAPSMVIIFSKALNSPVKYWLNDFLNGRCKEVQVLIDISNYYNLKGKLQVGLANPSVEAIQNMMLKSQAWEAVAVKKLFSLLSSLNSDMGIDYCIFDTSPGVQYSSVNALACSDVCVIVMNSDLVDLIGTKNMLKDIFDILDKKTVIILNKFSPENRIIPNEENDLVSKTEEILKHPVISKIPCYCDVLQAERMALLAIQQPDHPFIKKLEEVADKIDGL